MLCEGETHYNLDSETYWTSRFNFFNRQYNIQKNVFLKKTMVEFKKLCQYKSSNEIVLWFESDLFCQINLLAVVSWLKKNRKNTPISLICHGNEVNTNQHYNLGEFSPPYLKQLYTNRVALAIDDLEYADYVWQLYCSNSPIQLQNIPDNPKFIFVKEAIKNHLKRFPFIKNGLNEVENRIITTIHETQPKSKKKLLKNLLTNQHDYGFGNLQYEKKINSLQLLIKEQNPMRLTDLGIDVLQLKQNFYPSIRNNFSFLGGSLKYNYLYNQSTGKILKL